MLTRLFAAACLAGTMFAAPALTAPMTESDAAPIVARSDRTAADTDLDAGRMPAKALAFMQVEPGDRVLDVFAGGGYYSELLSRAVGPKGFVIAQNPAGFRQNERVQQAMATRGYGDRLANVAPMFRDFDDVYLAPNSLDVALFHLVYHDLYFENPERGMPRTSPVHLLAQLNGALKPGGTVTVIDHLGNGEDPRAEAAAVHRIDPETVIRDFRQAGFDLVAQESFFENPEDDPSQNVFDAAVRGKTDRFALRFAKAGDPNAGEAIAETPAMGGSQEEVQMCDAEAPQRLLGQVYSEDVRRSAMSMAGTENVRAYPTDGVVTMDYRPDRLNIIYDPDTKKVVEFKCG